VLKSLRQDKTDANYQTLTIIGCILADYGLDQW
jgi:hypothetical protein